MGQWSSVVVKSDGTTWDMDVDGLIGNGSTVAVTLSVYDTRKSIVGTRLDRVKVLEHVKPPSDDDDEVDYATTTKVKGGAR